MVEYKHFYSERKKMHLIELDYESFNMHKGKYLYEDIIRNIPEVATGELTYVLKVTEDVMYYANRNGTIGENQIDIKELGDITWETHTYGTDFNKAKSEDENVENNSQENN